MARLFIRHKPVKCVVAEGINDEIFYIDERVLITRGLSTRGPNNVDVAYVCFVRDGNCWAARGFRIMANNQLRVQCVPFNDDPSGQEMILADMILN